MNEVQPKTMHTDNPAVWPMVWNDLMATYGHGPAVMALVEEFTKRHEVGIERYGEPLTGSNGRDSLLDALQEGADLAVYTRAVLWEEDSATRKTLTHVQKDELRYLYGEQLRIVLRLFTVMQARDAMQGRRERLGASY